MRRGNVLALWWVHHRLMAKTTIIIVTCLLSAWHPLFAAEIKLQFANLHNPYFPDREPGSTGSAHDNFVFAPAPEKLFGIEGDKLPVSFTLFSKEAQKVSIGVKVTQINKKSELSVTHLIDLYRVRDILVEGNTNGSCACPAGQLPQTGETSRMVCVINSSALESKVPKGCPTKAQRDKISGTLVRIAPFAIKDALESFKLNTLYLGANVTELFIADIPIEANLPKGELEVQVTVTPESGIPITIIAPMRVLRLRLDNFPALDVSYWLSEDPRDLVARPEDIPLNGNWGGEWWSEEHWRNLEHAAQLQSKLGITNVLVPLFVRNPFGVKARPLIGVRCITGSTEVPTNFSSPNKLQLMSPFNKELSNWKYEFDFRNFNRFVGIFKHAGFRRFEGAHLMSSQGQLPIHLECDLYRTVEDKVPYARNFRFMPRVGVTGEDLGQKAQRVELYQERFLPTFMRHLSAELLKEDIGGAWYQHLIDENASSESAIAAYKNLVTILRENMPKISTMDAINQYTGPRYQGLIDLPVFHLALLYDDQMIRKNIRLEIDKAFPRPKYFYNTALREGGPNQFLDTNPLENRVYGWLAIELGYQGILYWAANQYRYPLDNDISRFNRPKDWNPYNHSQGPMPNGYLEPGYSPGANWQLYPTPTGLIDSLRARRFRDGLLDNWIYLLAWEKCKTIKESTCKEKLISIRQRLIGDSYIISDFAKNPVYYDNARREMLSIIEP
jgi:hypothetical protein